MIRMQKSEVFFQLLLITLVGILGLLLVINNKEFIYLFILLFTVVAFYFTFNKKLILFEGFSLFSFYYFTLLIPAIYLYVSNFEKSVFINYTTFSQPLDELFLWSLIYYIVGYIFAYFGFKIFKKNEMISIDLHNDGVSKKVLNIIIIAFSIIGLLNFIYNIIFFSGGNLFDYITNVSVRALMFNEEGGTQAGYLFAYMAAYMWVYKILKYHTKYRLFLLYLIITILMKATTGRIFGTLLYMLSFFAIFYFVNIKIQRKKHFKYFGYFGLMFLFGVLFYFFRITSSLAYNDMLTTDWIGTIIEFMNIDYLMYYAVDKGNTPNIALFMKIIDSWANDVGYLYGESLFTWIYSLLPRSMRPEDYQISAMASNIWYSHVPSNVQGGNLPPTGIGEMYANFGILGPFLGMFIFGSIVAFFYNLLLKFNNFWYLVVYVNISLGFFMIYAKGEFDNFSLWFIIPTLMTYLLLIFLTKVLRRKNN